MDLLIGGSVMAYKIAIIFLIISIVLTVLSMVLGGGFGRTIHI